MVAVLSGIGGFLSCLALSIAARGISSLRRPKTIAIPQPQQLGAAADPDPDPSSISPTSPSNSGIRVIRTTRQALDWKESDDRLVGTYKAQNGTYAGYIRNWQSQSREFYIVSPPATLRDHIHGKALSHRGQGRYLIRFAVVPTSTLAGVRAVEQMLAEAEKARPQSERILVRPVLIARGVVRPKNRLYWQLKDWTVQGDLLVGKYQTQYGSAEGYIEQHRSTRPHFFIMNPPEQLKKHSHWRCFSHIGGNHYSIHFYPAPANTSGGIREVEKVLAEALRPRRRRT